MLNQIVRSNAVKVAKLAAHDLLHPRPLRGLSYIHNLHQPPTYYVNGVKHINDYDTEEYRPQIQAFLTKRRTVKREIPPKVAGPARQQPEPEPASNV